MKLRLLLAHYAEEQSGMLFISGAGWTEIGPDPSPFAIAGLLQISWDETNRPHEIEITIVDSDGQPFMHPTATGEQAFRVHASATVGRPPTARAGQWFSLPIAINFQPLQFRPGTDYIVRGVVNGTVLDEVPFMIRPARPQPPQQP